MSFAALLLLSPGLALLAVLVRVLLGSPVFFKQQRPGYKEKIFTLYKFRTMNNKKDDNGELLPDSERLTKFGRLLRATSLDELPELYNILKGDMSFVGPRPLSVKYLPYYTQEERQRHDVKPGLTGLAQVKGRNALSWEEKFAFDIAYINNVSFIRDIEIMLQTAIKVLKRADIGQAEQAPESFHITRERKN